MGNIVKTVKIRNKCIEIYTGDYILFNGACYQFCTGDKRVLGVDQYIQYTSIPCTKKMLSEVNLDTLRKVEYGSKEKRTYAICYYF